MWQLLSTKALSGRKLQLKQLLVRKVCVEYANCFIFLLHHAQYLLLAPRLESTFYGQKHVELGIEY